ncbi:M20 metallopeptidase family protein [Oceanivirga miroungae]|uniref:Amidohydrolase n=1 Tax=Oceanivirga miroungae TaxID=1130046 RepID=A0A6I8M9F0_9FUSO|nr:M20 family metallopeptidase [Oceanivirga miroungae]VWL85435.1 amidohydrolase [Oceanivirga miroungae]
MNEYIKNLVEKLKDEVISYRRWFHENPELSEKEYMTKNKIIEFLNENNIQYRLVLETGIHAYIENKKGLSLAYRADMDALPIKEENDLEYISKNVGVMHACGHDVHLAVQLGLIKALNESKDKWHGTVNFFFQPAEETVGGAKRMLECGVNNPKNDALFSFHSAPEILAGKVGIKYGKMHATSAVFKLEIIGKEAHAALAYKGVDAISISAKVIEYLSYIVSRKLDARNSGVITVGKINGGTAENIVANKVELTGTIRTLDKKTKEYIVSILNNELKDFVKSFNANLNVFIRDSYVPVINDKEFTDFLKENAVDILGEDNVIEINETRMDVEDIGYFLEQIPGSFYRLGVSASEKFSDLHTKNLMIDEKALEVGLMLNIKLALEYLK